MAGIGLLDSIHSQAFDGVCAQFSNIHLVLREDSPFVSRRGQPSTLTACYKWCLKTWSKNVAQQGITPRSEDYSQWYLDVIAARADGQITRADAWS